MMKEIIKIDNPLLKTISTPVGDFKLEKVKNTIKELKETVYKEKGVGLSAVQIGISDRIFVLNINGICKAYINPSWSLHKRGELVEMNEGCLSDKGHFIKVQRYNKIRIEYYDEDGHKFTETLNNLWAQAFQHETDHLNGKIFLDLEIK